MPDVMLEVYFSGKIEASNWYGLRAYYRHHPELEKDFHTFDQWFIDMALYKIDELRQKEAVQG